MSKAGGWRAVALIAVLAAAVGPAFGSDVRKMGRGDHSSVQPDVVGGYASTHLVVKFHPGVFRRDTGIAVAPRSDERARREPVLSEALQATCTRWGATRIRPLYPYEFANPELAARLGLDRAFVIEVPAGTDVPAMAGLVRAHGAEVQAAWYDGIGTVALEPDDPYFYQQWNMHNPGPQGAVEDADIDGPEAWDIHTGDLGTVTIAIIDSGIGGSVANPHADFSGRMVPGINTIDPGEQDVTIDECTSSVNGHGTHVAGIAAAVGNNRTGVAGVTWGAYIMPVRVLGGYHGCWGLESHCAAGIIWAADHGADVCNISLQFYNGFEVLESAVEYAYAQGVLVVASAGNELDDVVAFPARFEHCMAVSATTDDDTLASWSNYGDELDVCAPGEHIKSTVLGHTYAFGTGTSMSAPHVAGLAALIKSYVPGMPPVTLRTIINRSADDLGEPGWDREYGHGRISAYQALMMAESTRWIISSDPPDSVIDARQPSEPNGSDPAGWDRMDLTFSGDVSEVRDENFTVAVEGGGPVPEVGSVLILIPPSSLGDVDDGWSPTRVDSVLRKGEDTVTVVLDSRIPLVAWTTIEHDPSGTSGRIAHLPGDVNGDGMSDPFDIPALIDALNGVTDLELWQTDLNRDGEPVPADVRRLMDLLDGEGEYAAYLGATLP